MSVEEETDRVLPVVRALAEQGVCVSVDTRHAAVAKACVEAGAAVINDVSGFRDPAMVQVAAESDCGVVVMHMKGEPGTMQQNPQYDDVVAEVRDYLRDQAAMLEAAGVAPERICVDRPASAKRLRRPSSSYATSRSLRAWATRSWLPFPAKAIWASPTASTTRSSVTM